MKKILTISNSDSSSGSGIQGDIKTISMLGCYACSVITSVNAQNTIDTQLQYPLPAEVIKQQINTVLSDIQIDAVKIGVVSNVEMVEAIMQELNEHPQTVLVYDVSLMNYTGKQIIEDDVIDSIKSNIIKNATIVTPNIYEAELLSGMKIFTDEDAVKAAKTIQEIGAKNVLIKGAHMVGDEIKNIFVNEKAEVKIFKHNRIKTDNTHGAGCTLSSSIACYLAKGQNIESAIDLSIEYVISIISDDFRIGRGRNPLVHNMSLLDNSGITTTPLP